MTHVVVLGGGPAGYVAAVRGRQLGAEVTLVEMDRLGGVCLHRGCIPSKVLLRSAELARLAPGLDEFGVRADYRGFDWPQALRRKERIVAQLAQAIEQLLARRGVTVIQGRGRLLEPRVVEVETHRGVEILRADRVLVCPGSSPAPLPVPGGDAAGLLTSDELLAREEPPESIIIIGGGYIGAEFADLLNALGVRVTVIEMLPRLLPQADEEVSAEVARAFRRRRIEASAGAKVTGIAPGEGGWTVHFRQGEKERTAQAAAVLVAVGRTPNTRGLGLEEAGIALERGRVVVNERLETSAEGVYACGDVLGRIMLAHVASAEGKVAVANALGADLHMDYRAIPSAIFTHPEVGSVGLTEEQARADGREVKVGRFSFRGVGKALAEGERDGLVKIVSDARTGEVLGGHIVGLHATEMVHELALAIHLRARAEDIAELVHAHPSLSEPIMEAAEDVLGRAIHK